VKKLLPFILLICCCSFLLGCGQNGPLFLPDTHPTNIAIDKTNEKN